MAKSIPNDIFQYSLFSAFDAGLTEGGPPVASLTTHGNHGVGIFEDDEEDSDRAQGPDLIQLNGVTFSIDHVGRAAKAERDHQAPFVMVTVFQPQHNSRAPSRTSRQKIQELFKSSRNTPMPFRLTGEFNYISTRQQTYWDVKGTIFGFCIPAWQSHISGEGLQCCFLAEDQKSGGKVLDFETGNGATLEWAKCGRFHLGFPQDEEYDQLRLTSQAR